ncbi:MAG TPA: tRNA(His) guanylyltransferase Thg1 family protein [Candidatus Glassbacteria bacterium]|nr:tRNA(His) guanylyltransferase Thg1 family protein [Candidatus Glassbacteria bacterium]
MAKDSIGNRMKENYEDRYRIKLTRRMPVIIRLDGKAFHTLTRSCKKPFDHEFQEIMQNTGYFLLSRIQGAKCAYIQSDEISILLTDFDKLNTDAWFDYNIQKIVSISAAMASVYFSTARYNLSFDPMNGVSVFDSRAFNIPKEEVCNYFIWRQQDWLRNSIQMLHGTGLNWNDLESKWKNGLFVVKDDDDRIQWGDEIIFTQNRESVERFLNPIENVFIGGKSSGSNKIA